MDCPNCGATMRERDRSGVKVDFCPACKGIWLDRGELDKIIAIELGDDDDFGASEAGARSAEPARAVRRRDDDDDDDDDRRYRDEGRRYRDEDDYRSGKKKSKKSTFFESLTDMFGGEAE